MRAATNQRVVELVQIPVVSTVHWQDEGLEGQQSGKQIPEHRLQLKNPAEHYVGVNTGGTFEKNVY